MSGKYDNVVKLLTPISTLENAGLLFKMTYEMKDGNFVPRSNVDSTKNNFYSGKGPGWISQDRDDDYANIKIDINEKIRLCMEYLYIEETYGVDGTTLASNAKKEAERFKINGLILAGRPKTPYNPVSLVVPRDSNLKPSGPPPDMNYYPRDLADIVIDINKLQKNEIDPWLAANPNKKLILDLASIIIYELRNEIIKDNNGAGEKNIARGVLELQKDLTANRALLNLLNTIFTFTDGAGNPINILLNGSIKEDMINNIGTGAATLEVAIKDPNLPAKIFNNALPVNGELLYSDSISGFGRDAKSLIIPTNLPTAYNNAVAAHRGRLFSWNIGQYMVRKTMNMKKPQGTNAWSSLIENVIGPKYDEIVGRDGKNRFTIKKEDGTTELLESFTKSQSTCNQSGQTGTAAGSDTDCFNRIMKCTLSLNNTDGSAVALVDSQCMTALEQNNVWKVTKDKIRALNTPMIVDLLKKIGMKAYTQSVTGKNIIESYEDWKKKVDDNKLTKNDGSVYVIPNTSNEHDRAKALAAKGEFKDFITALIGYVNSNPLILNPKSKDDKKTKTDKFGISTAYGNNKLEPFRNLINLARNSIFSIHSAIGSRFVNLNGINVTPAYQLFGFTGGDQEGGFLSGVMSTRKVEVPKFAKQLRSIYDHYVNRLATLNKKLSPATEQSVEAVFSNLEDVEKKLSQWIDYLYKYTEVMRIENNYDKDNFVGAVELKDAFEKYERLLSKFSRRSVNMIDILSTIANATDTESSKTRTVPLSL